MRHRDLKRKETEDLIDELMTRVDKRARGEKAPSYTDDSSSIIDLQVVGTLLDEPHRRGEKRRTRIMVWLTAVITALTVMVALNIKPFRSQQAAPAARRLQSGAFSQLLPTPAYSSQSLADPDRPRRFLTVRADCSHSL